MKFKKDARITTGDFWYDLTDGGYIKPENLLENEADVLAVKKAIETLKEFLRSARDQDVLEVM